MTAPSYVPAPPVPRPQLSGVALAAVILAAGEVVALLAIKTLAAAFGFSRNDLTTVSVVLGVLGLVSIVWTAAVLVLGHLGIRRSVLRGRLLAAIALGVGYVQLLLWINRLVVATLAAVAANDASQWVPDIFWWASRGLAASGAIS